MVKKRPVIFSWQGTAGDKRKIPVTGGHQLSPQATSALQRCCAFTGHPHRVLRAASRLWRVAARTALLTIWGTERPSQLNIKCPVVVCTGACWPGLSCVLVQEQHELLHLLIASQP